MSRSRPPRGRVGGPAPPSSPSSPASPTSPRPARHPGLVLALAALALVAALAVLPARAYLAQAREREAVRDQLLELDQVNEGLQARLDLLGSDAEIERLARQRQQLVKPGEEAYAILPEAPPGPQGSAGAGDPPG